MNKILSALFSCLILTAGNPAFAQDSMKMDSMMKKDAMKKDAMKKDAMKKDSMGKAGEANAMGK